MKEIVFTREALTGELIRELVPLIAQHHVEISRFQHLKLEPDFELYQRLDKHGILRFFTVRRKGDLYGYSVFHVTPHPHFKSSLQATEDILFLSPDLRKGFNGYKFIRWCDNRLKKDGVTVIYRNVNNDHDFGPLLDRAGYEPVDIVYARRV